MQQMLGALTHHGLDLLRGNAGQPQLAQHAVEGLGKVAQGVDQGAIKIDDGGVIAVCFHTVMDYPHRRPRASGKHHRRLNVWRFHAASCQRWNRGRDATSPVTRSTARPSSRTTSKLRR
jgi:hypothetical protein